MVYISTHCCVVQKSREKVLYIFELTLQWKFGFVSTSRDRQDEELIPPKAVSLSPESG